jgi:nicotinate-nucleotide adenylyltransferase
MVPAGEEVVKIGVFGGTFDPVHRGHLAIAEEARKSLGIAEVILVPAGQPVSEKKDPVSPAADRLEMLRLAVAGKPYLKVSTLELERPGPSYTVDTIAEICRQRGGKDVICFILGWDSLAQVGKWHEPERIISLCYLVAVPRPGWPRPDLKVLEKKVPGICKRLVLLEKPRLDISATVIRHMAADGKPIDAMVPRPVAEYIRQHRLYLKR